MNQLEEITNQEMEIKVRAMADQLLLHYPTQHNFNELYKFGEKIVKKHRQRMGRFLIYVAEETTFEIIYDPKIFNPEMEIALKPPNTREVQQRLYLIQKGFNIESFEKPQFQNSLRRTLTRFPSEMWVIQSPL
ncbi:MAG: hypothetical protein AABX16_03570 [Nanoarchaeota archaeon]